MVVENTIGIESPRCIISHDALFTWIWIYAVVLSLVVAEVDDDELVVLDDEDDNEGGHWTNIALVAGSRESFSIWLRLKSEKCLSILDFIGGIAIGKHGSARTICLSCCSFLTVILNGSGDDDNTGLAGCFKTGWIWWGKDRRENGVRRI